MPTKIAGVIQRRFDRKIIAQFYTRLGLTLTEHRHSEEQPLHFEVGPVVSKTVFEIYNASERYPEDALVLAVDSIKKFLKVVEKFGIPIKETRVENDKFLWVYILDPDGRDVMIIENPKPVEEKKKNKKKKSKHK